MSLSIIDARQAASPSRNWTGGTVAVVHPHAGPDERAAEAVDRECPRDRERLARRDVRVDLALVEPCELDDRGGGAADGAVAYKAGYGEQMARELRLPLVRLVDGTGGGGSVKTLDEMKRTYVPANPAWDTVVALLSEVPVVGACMGSVAGLGAARVVTSHFSVTSSGSTMHVSSPRPPNA